MQLRQFFSHTPTVLLHLRRQELIMQSPDKEKMEVLPVPAEVVQHLEVTDMHRWQELLTEFIKAQKVQGQRILVVLDEDVLFLEVIPLQSATLESKTADFISKLPFDPDNRQVVQLSLKDHAVLCGVNKQLYQPLVQAVAQQGNKVVAVVPAPLYRVKSGATFEPAKVARVLADNTRLHLANFLMPEKT